MVAAITKSYNPNLKSRIPTITFERSPFFRGIIFISQNSGTKKKNEEQRVYMY